MTDRRSVLGASTLAVVAPAAQIGAGAACTVK